MLVLVLLYTTCGQVGEPPPQITAANFRRLLCTAVDNHSQSAIALRIQLESWIKETNDVRAIEILRQEAEASASVSSLRYVDVLLLLLAAESKLGRRLAKECMVSRLDEFEKNGVRNSWRGPKLGAIIHGLAKVEATEDLGRAIALVKVEDDIEMASAISAAAKNGSKKLIPVLLAKRVELHLSITRRPQAIAKYSQKISGLIQSIENGK